jgi:hypothetical protein
MMVLQGVLTIGIWSDVDSAEIRSALRVLRKESWPIRYLEDPEIPERFRRRPAY